MSQQDVLNKLRKEKARLLKLAKEKRAAELRKQRAAAEERKLKAEIAKLKSEVQVDIKTEAKKVVKGIRKDLPAARKKAKIFLKGVNKGLDNLQKFANKYG